MVVQKSPLDPAFKSFRCVSRSEIAGLYSNSIFNFLRNYNTFLYSGHTILYFYQQRTRVSVSLITHSFGQIQNYYIDFSYMACMCLSFGKSWTPTGRSWRVGVVWFGPEGLLRFHLAEWGCKASALLQWPPTAVAVQLALHWPLLALDNGALSDAIAIIALLPLSASLSLMSDYNKLSSLDWMNLKLWKHD